MKILKLNYLIAATVSLALALHAPGDPGRAGNARQAVAAAPARVSAPVHALAPSARFVGAPRIGGAHFAAPVNGSIINAPRITSSATQAQFARQRAIQNVAAT